MAETRTDRRGSFWIWATLVIVLAAILAAWLMQRNDGGDGDNVIPPVETGATP